MKNEQIVIIGGGACGVAAFIELFIELKAAGLERKLDITIIEPDDIGKGLAFGTKQPGHLLNTQADLMGIHPSEPAHYSQWLESNSVHVESETTGLDSPEDAYSTRRLYSDYLREQFHHYYDIATTSGSAPTIIKQRAVDIIRDGNHWNIILDNSKAILSKFVLLAPGTPKPNNYPELDGTDNYIDSPWPSEPIINGIRKEAKVGILGSSLSAIDAIMTLVDNDHRGQIHLFSPDGMLPRVQPEGDTTYQRRFLTEAAVHEIKRTSLRPLRATDLFRLFKKEAEFYHESPIDWQNTGRENKPARHFLSDDIKIAEEGGDAFINILYALRYEAATIWQWMPTEEKQKFKQWIGAYWTSNRHGMPLANARRLERLFEMEKLFVHPNLKNVQANKQSKQFNIEHGHGRETVDFLINATGPGTNIDQMKSTLIQNLHNRGIIEAYNLGGIKIEPATMQVVSHGSVQENLYIVGHLCNGILLDVNAVWYNVKTVARACKHMLNRIKGEYYA